MMSETQTTERHALHDFVDFHLPANRLFHEGARRLLEMAFDDFADGYWCLGITNEQHILGWRTPATWDEAPVDMTVTPEVLLEAFRARTHADEPFHPEDYASLKDALAKWRGAVERIEEMLAKARIR